MPSHGQDMEYFSPFERAVVDGRGSRRGAPLHSSLQPSCAGGTEWWGQIQWGWDYPTTFVVEGTVFGVQVLDKPQTPLHCWDTSASYWGGP